MVFNLLNKLCTLCVTVLLSSPFSHHIFQILGFALARDSCDGFLLNSEAESKTRSPRSLSSPLPEKKKFVVFCLFCFLNYWGEWSLHAVLIQGSLNISENFPAFCVILLFPHQASKIHTLLTALSRANNLTGKCSLHVSNFAQLSYSSACDGQSYLMPTGNISIALNTAEAAIIQQVYPTSDNMVI